MYLTSRGPGLAFLQSELFVLLVTRPSCLTSLTLIITHCGPGSAHIPEVTSRHVTRGQGNWWPLTTDYWHVLSLWTRGAPETRVCNPVSDCCVRLASTWHHIIVTLTSSWHLLVVIRHRHCCFHYRHWAQSWVVNDGFNSEAGQQISWFLNSRIYVRCM